jgi:hypothetical protein
MIQYHICNQSHLCVHCPADGRAGKSFCCVTSLTLGLVMFRHEILLVCIRQLVILSAEFIAPLFKEVWKRRFMAIVFV